MTETQKRIKAYQDALPGLRERVAAVALLLVMSMAMMTSASFAWLTISRSPEVSGVSTNIAANGSLEIALATGDGTTAPGESKVGDSSAAEGQSVFNANQTWGNLINLSDPAYGLDHLALRPAQLNTAALLTSPLYGAVYGQDGRITQLSSDFGYASWVPPTAEVQGYFAVSDQVGVRAISSTKYDNPGGDVMRYNMIKAAKDKNLAAGNQYAALANKSGYMQSLATMMGLYMTARMNPDHATLSNPECKVADLQNLRDMYGAFLECFDAEADAMASLANLVLFLKNGENYTPYTAEMIFATTEAALKAEGIQITRLEEFKKDYKTITSDYQKLVDLCEAGTSLKWKDSGLNGIVNNLVDVGKCTIGADNTPISSIGASNAMGYLSGTQEARITNGILYRFEERTGGYIQVKNLSISASVNRLGMTIPATVKANIQTTASRDYNLFTEDQKFAEAQDDGVEEGGFLVAEDTYGLAVDFWVRTNSEGSFLTLEGNLLTESKMVQAMGKDAEGNDVQIYTATISATSETGESLSYSVDLYKVEENNTVTWYKADSHSVMTEEELNGATPNLKQIEEITILGYEGENRVWGDNELMSTDATTQGSGSCYVYYADTPEDQARSLKLLEAFNVAFVDSDGKLMASAIMDTQHYYASSGRVIVPLVLDPSKSVNLGEDFEGNVTYAISALEKNIPTRITAIVYLDGTKLSNQEVLAAADIQGQLNIQFGSSSDLNAITNEELENKERRVSATVDKSSFDYDTATGPMISRVTVHVDGDEPSSVTAFFLRSINASQGSREEVMTFTKNANGDWIADYEFKVPGNYVLRTVKLDGIDYDLASPPEVKVAGFAIASLSCDEATNSHIKVMTAANTTTANLRLKFSTDDPDKLPKKVQGRFLRDDGTAVNIDFTYNATTQYWSGAATFLVSGEYSMHYLVLDGEYTELDSAMWLTADVTLGMRVAVYTTSPHKFIYKGENMADNEKLLSMQVMIYDNAGEEMPGMDKVKLTYGMRGSAIKKMDTDLTWNGSYYVGELTVYSDAAPGEGENRGGIGVWQFGNVTVGSNVLTTATTSPTFTIQSAEPPEYKSHATPAKQTVPNSAAVMNAVISNSSAAAVQAYIQKDGAATGKWVDGVIGQTTTTDDGKSANYWNFTFSQPGEDGRDGTWRMITLRMWDVFAADGTPYTEEAPLEIDVSAKGIATEIVSTVTPVFPEGLSKDFGKENGTVTGTFMQEHTVSGLKVAFKSGTEADAAVFGAELVKDVSLEFVYVDASSAANGGYNSDHINSASVRFTVNLTYNSATGYFEQTEDAKLLYAGNYYTYFRYTVGDKTITCTDNKQDPDYKAKGYQSLPGNAPKLSVWSVVPYVQFTATNPAAGTEFTGINAAENANVTRKNSISSDKYSVTCYFKGEISQSEDDCGDLTNSCSGYTASKATTTLYNLGSNFTSATCTIISKGEGANVVFTYSPTALSNEQNIGSTSGSGNNAKRLGIGTNATATTLVVVGKDGNTYTFTLVNPLYATATE